MTETSIGELVLGRYRIVRPLGSGGMGVVYLGRTEGAEGFARPVVVKRLPADLAGNRRHNEMFVREARILSNLQHPNIVGVIDFGREDRAYVMVLEYVHGFDLAQWAAYVQEVRARIDVDHALYIVRKVLDALHYAHHLKRQDGNLANIVHRDVSPSNILLDEQAQVKLHDFGIARMEGVGDGLTEGDTFKGKLGYAAPELLAGSGAASPSSDSYAAAIILYQLVAGTNPFRCQNATETVSRILNYTPPLLASLREDVPDGLDEIVRKGLAKNASERFASAAEFSRALGALEHRPDEDVLKELAQQFTSDFAAIPAHFKLESLEERDAAWRQDQTGPLERRSSLSSSRPTDRDSDPTVIHTAPKTKAGVEILASNHTLVSRNPGRWNKRATKQRAIVAAAVTINGLLLVTAAVVFVSRKPGEASTRYLVIEKPPDNIATAAPGQEHAPLPNEGTSSPPSLPAPEAIGQPSPPPAANSASKPSGEGVSGPPSSAALSQRFRKREQQIEACFRQHAAQMQGRPQISVRFEVDTSGNVTNTELSPSSIGSTPLGACVRGVARSVNFGRFQGPVAFSIPITLRQTE